MDDIDMYELAATRPEDRRRKTARRVHEKVNALGIGAQGLGGLTTVLDVKIKMYPTHAASKPVAMIPNCAATRHAHFVLDGSGPAYLDPPSLDLWPNVQWAPDYEKSKRVNLDTLTKAEVASWKPGRHAAAVRQDAHRPRRRAQAHPGHARQGRETAGRLHQPRHLLRRPGRPGARRSGRPGRPDHRHAHGQVHRDDAGADRADRDDRQGRARPGGDRGDQEAQERLPDGGRRRRLSGRQGDQGRQGASASPTSAWKRSTSSTSRTCRSRWQSAATAPRCIRPARASGRPRSARSRSLSAERIRQSTMQRIVVLGGSGSGSGMSTVGRCRCSLPAHHHARAIR